MIANTHPIKLIDSRELASRLGVHQYTLVNLTKTGKIPAFKIGNEYRYSWNEIIEATRFTPTESDHASITSDDVKVTNP